MKTSEALRIGRAKIAAGGLAKEAFARDARGFAVGSLDLRARSFCMVGALEGAHYDCALTYLNRCIPKCYLPSNPWRAKLTYFSDHFANTRAALALYDCAIELAEKEEGAG